MLIMWYRNLFIKITYMYSSLLKRRLQRVVLRITAAPRSRRGEAAGSARGPDPPSPAAPPGPAAGGLGAGAAPARPCGGSAAAGRGWKLSGREGFHLPRARPGCRGVRRGQEHPPTPPPPEPAFLGARQLQGTLRVTFPSGGGGGKSRQGGCWTKSCPHPSRGRGRGRGSGRSGLRAPPPAPGSAPLRSAPHPASRLRSPNDAGENPSPPVLLPPSRGAYVPTFTYFLGSPKIPDPRPSCRGRASRGRLCSVLPLVCLQ